MELDIYKGIGITMLITGIIFLSIGVILLLVNQNSDKQWYVWFFLYSGLFMLIIGGFLISYTLYYKNKNKYWK